MKVRELKEVLAGADDDAEVIVTRHTTFEGAGVMKFRPRDIFETVGAVVQPSGKVGISYDESKKTNGIYVWTEDVTYDWSLSNWTSAFKHTWGHRWIEYPGGSVGFWPTTRPADPISSVPGMVQSPDPNSKVSHSSFTKEDTLFQQTSQRCVNCEKATKCVADFARTYKCDYSLGLNNCRDFVAQALGTCGLTTQSPTDYWSTHK